MFCKNCGRELPDGVKFCAGCGTPVAPQGPSAAPDFPVTEQVPSAAPDFPAAEPFPSADVPPVSEVPPISEVPPVSDGPADSGVSGAMNAIRRRGKSGMIVLGGIAVVAILAVVLVVKLVGGLLGGGGGKGALQYAYLTDDYELMYLPDLKEKTEALEVSDKNLGYGLNVAFSPDGKAIYYKDSMDSLYKATLSDLKKNGSPERISRNVSSFQVLKDGRVLYTEVSNSGDVEVSVFNGKESFRVVKGCSGYQLDEKEKNLYYTERSKRNDTLTLYKIALTKDAKEEELLSGAGRIFSSWSADVLVYGEWSDSARKGNNTLTVYSCKPGGNAAELVEDVYGVSDVTVDGSKVTFYYTVEKVEEYTLYDFVSDAQAGADASLLSQELVRPNSYDYSPTNVFFENGVWSYTDRRGETFAIDSSVLMQRYEQPLEEIPSYRVNTVAREMGSERYNAAYAEYSEKYDAWYAAQNREYIRQSLKDNSYNQTSYSLYHYNNSAPSDPIAEGVANSGSNYSDGIFIYKKAPSVDGGKVCDVSDLSYAGDVYSYLNSGSSDDDWYVNVGGKESTLEKVDPEAYISGIYVLGGKEVVLNVYEDGEPMLVSYTLGKDSLTYSSVVLDDEFSLRTATDSSGNDVLYLFTDTDSSGYRTVADLSVYKSGGKVEKIAEEIFGAYFLENGATYLITDIDNRGGYEMAVLKDGKPSTICDEVDTLCGFLDKTQFLYLSDGDLYLWNGKDSRRIAKDVTRCWVNNSAEISVVLFP